ncbi:200_t:CDS:1 [Acaulospora colombiana]|uniref:200_t:CDS:1 n=1 Tax=Acaulospora colombiana TaxID=27376 RepID=A0ACA9MGU8_9GLOM|nr:200_t:CDS:1 [Acaulospora colombiana]
MPSIMNRTEFLDRINVILESNALQARLYHQAPNPNMVIHTIRKNGRSFRDDLKFVAYNAFSITLCNEAKLLLNETSIDVLNRAATMLWKRAPQHTKQDYRTCAQMVSANIPKRRLGRV